MPRVDCLVESDIVRTPIVMQIEGMFDISAAEKTRVEFSVDMPIEDKPWNVGLVVGPSGSGKSTLARKVFGDSLVSSFPWDERKAIVDSFPRETSIKDVTALLSSVGFSSPPAWLRPFHVLSTGEQFRVMMARAMSEMKSIAVIDEFTSVVDRTVARVGSAAIAKTIRARGQRFVAVTCHYDIAEWLQPDWVIDMASKSFSWRVLQQRPDVKLVVSRVHRSAWELFRYHHYLDSSINKASYCFLGKVEGQPATFSAVLSFPHPVRSGWREHRTVCLPDFQGIGLGNAMSEYVASLFRATGKPYRSTTSHPSMIGHRSRSRIWRTLSSPDLKTAHNGTCTGSFGRNGQRSGSVRRLSASHEYIGPSRPDQARAFGLPVPPA